MLVDSNEPLPLIQQFIWLNEFLQNIDFKFIIQIAVLSLLLLFSALVSGTEVALFKLSQEDFDEFDESNNTKERSILFLLKKPQKLLATLLILNNLINVCIVLLSTFFIALFFINDETSKGILFTLLTIINTFSIVIFGEFIPKEFAYNHPLRFSKLTIYFIVFFTWLLSPLSYILTSFTSIIETKISKKNIDFSEEHLDHALEIMTDKEGVDSQKTILKGIVSLSSIPAKQVMRSRIDITGFEYDTDFHTLLKKIKSVGHSRIPIYKDTLDNIEGILYIKDLLIHLEEDKNFRWQNLLKNVFYIPENKNIEELLKNFQEKRVHIAIAVDEYGGTSGLVTLEDILEEIIGEIHDEFDEKEAPNFKKIDQDTFIFEGKTSIADFCKVINIPNDELEESKGESESIAGLLLEINEEMPLINEIIEYKNIKFTILEATQRVIKSIKIELGKN